MTGAGSPFHLLIGTPPYKCLIYGGKIAKRFFGKKGNAEYLGLTLKMRYI
jgi:hypothetical protein